MNTRKNQGEKNTANFGLRPNRPQKNKAQITFTFVVSAAMFVGLVIYIVSTIFNMVNPYFAAASQQESEAYAYMVSTMLLSSPGYWDDGLANGTDWENQLPQKTVSLGLATEAPQRGFTSPYHRLSMSKVERMSSLDNARIRSLLGEGHLYAFCIGPIDTQGCNLLDKTGQAFTGAMVTRYAVVENGTQTIPVRMVVEVL